MQERIGFIGQGYIGKNYADDFEERGFAVVRYSLEDAYVGNKEKIKDCDIVFIAVPTPTTEKGADASIIKDALSLVGVGKTAVIKSTVAPGTTGTFALQFSDRYILHSPEFLSKATAAHDARHPNRNIIGVPVSDPTYRAKAEAVLKVLPPAPFSVIVNSTESEFLKYINNTFFYAKIVYMNVLYDLAEKLGCNWNSIRDAIAAEPWIGGMHIDPVHKSGRGAGGLCLIKDYAAFMRYYEQALGEDEEAMLLLSALERKNLSLLKSTGKDLETLKNIYGSI